MCCNCKENLLIVGLAIWIFIQSAAYATLAILGVVVYDCGMDMNDNKLTYLWYLIYFRHGACGDVNWSLLGLNIPNHLQPIWPDVTEVAYRTNIIVLLYLSLSIAWMITSMGLIFAACTSCIGRCYFYSSLISWSFIGILILLLDCAGLGVFVYDLVHLTRFSDMLDFLEITNAEEIMDAAGDFSAPFFLPSLLMLLTASRVFVLWAINIAIIILVIRFGSRIGRRKPKSVNNNLRPTPYEYGRDTNRDSPYTQGNDPNQMHPMRVTTQYNNAQPYGVVHRNSGNHNNSNPNNNGYNYNRGNATSENVPRIVPAAVMQSSQAQPNRNSNVYSQNGAYDNPAYPVKQSAPSDSMSLGSSTEPRSTDSGWVSSPSRQKKIPPETPPKPILKSKPRNSQLDQISNDNLSDRSDRNSSATPPAGLRSQLPWSYTSNPEDLNNKPKRTFVALRDDEDLPPVPVPDYTLHFPKNKRSGIDSK